MFGSDCKTPPPSSQTGGFMHSGGFRHRYFLTSLSSYGFQPTNQKAALQFPPSPPVHHSLKNCIFSHLLDCTAAISFRAHRLLTLGAQRGAEIAAKVALRRASSAEVIATASAKRKRATEKAAAEASKKNILIVSTTTINNHLASLGSVNCNNASGAGGPTGYPPVSYRLKLVL